MFQIDDVKRVLGDIKLILEELKWRVTDEDNPLSEDEQRLKREAIQYKLLYLQKNCTESSEINEAIKGEIDGLCRLYDETIMADSPYHFGGTEERESLRNGYMFFRSYIDVVLMRPFE